MRVAMHQPSHQLQENYFITVLAAISSSVALVAQSQQPVN